MSLLRIYNTENGTYAEYTEPEEIRALLKSRGILFERWATDHPLPKTATPDEIIQAYGNSIERLQQNRGFKTADVVAVHPDTPNHAGLRQKFLGEHTHSDDEARFFVDGRGLFYINAGPEVVALLCEKGDLVNVPAGTRHWFDMSSAPFFQCIRVFTDPAGWVGNFTGSHLPGRFPTLDEYPVTLA